MGLEICEKTLGVYIIVHVCVRHCVCACVYLSSSHLQDDELTGVPGTHAEQDA